MTKALSVRQPHAHAIACGIKHLENRTWTTTYRGPLLIHASSCRDNRDVVDEWREHYESLGMTGRDMRYGVIVARCNLVDIIPLEKASAKDRQRHIALGPWCWVLRDIVPLNWATRVRGELNIFEVDEDKASCKQYEDESGGLFKYLT